MIGYDVLRGAIELHIHPGPARRDKIFMKRRLDFLEAATLARDVGMKAVVFKPLDFPTVDWAWVAEKTVPGIRVFGGILLDYAVGGFNPEAVDIAINKGAKVVWMPVFDSLHTKKSAEKESSGMYGPAQKQREGLTIFDGSRALLPEVSQILDLIAKAGDVVLDTAHLSPEESIFLAREARSRGIKNIVAGHPEAEIIGATDEQLRQLAELGVYLNFCYAQTVSDGVLGPRTKWVVNTIKTLGAQHCCMSTDTGNNLFAMPIEALRCFTQVLMTLGVSEEEIDVMLRQNPAKVLGL
jgi:hypothetical protein